MRFGIGIPNSREGMYVPCSFAGPEEIVAITRLAEKLGFYSAWGTDFATHIMMINHANNTFQELAEQGQMFGEEVLPLFRR